VWTVAFPQRPCSGLVAKRSAAAIDGLPNGAEQHIVLERLRQDLDGSGPHRPDGHRDVAVASDEDNREVDSARRRLFPGGRDAEVGKVNVENEAARSQDSRVGKKLASGAEGSGRQPSARISSSSDSRTETSSSTTKTTGVGSAVALPLDPAPDGNPTGRTISREPFLRDAW